MRSPHRQSVDSLWVPNIQSFKPTEQLECMKINTHCSFFVSLIEPCTSETFEHRVSSEESESVCVLVFISGQCQRFTHCWWESSVSTFCSSTMPLTKTQSGEALVVNSISFCFPFFRDTFCPHSLIPSNEEPKLNCSTGPRRNPSNGADQFNTMQSISLLCTDLGRGVHSTERSSSDGRK